MLPNILEGAAFGESTMADLDELRKALDIGTSQPVTGVGFDALRVESLEGTLKVLTHLAKHARLWNMIAKLPAFSTVEEYNRLLSHGGEGGGFLASGTLPEIEDSSYERADQKVKFLGTTRVVNHPATLVRTVPAQLIATETQNGVLWMIGKANRGMYYGDSAAIPLEWNGLTKQIVDGAGHVVDLRGQPLTKDNLENGTQLVNDNFGFPTALFSNPRVFTDFAKLYHAQQRFNNPGTAGNVGTPVKGYSSLSGDISFEPDTFVKRGTIPPATLTQARAPTVPTLSPAIDAPVVAGSQFTAAFAGTYIYSVTAVNNFGESVASANTAGQAIATDGAVTLTITDGGGTDGATGYRIYRTDKGGATPNFMKLVERDKIGGVPQATTVYQDLNADLPATFIGLLLDQTPQSLSFKQLSPLIKMDLARIAPSIRWMQLLYGTPIVYAPKKNVLFKNIGLAN